MGEIIEEIIQSRKVKGEEVFEEANVSIYSLSKNGRIIPAKTSHIYRGKTNFIVKIELSSGRKIEVTLRHPLLVMNRYGRIDWKLPPGIDKDMKIAVPRTINISESIIEEKEVLLAELTGYILANGDVYINTMDNSSYVTFHNSGHTLRSRVKLLFQLIYGTDAREEFPIGRTLRIRVNKRNIVEDITGKSDVRGRKAGGAGIPPFVWKSKKTLAAFLRAYTDAGGTIDKTGVIINTSSKAVALDLLYAFNILGVIARLEEERTENNVYYNIIVPGEKQLNTFINNIGLIHPKKKPVIMSLLKNRETMDGVDTVYIPHSLRRVIPKLSKHLSRDLTKAEKRLLLEEERIGVETFNNLAAKIIPDLQRLLMDIEQRLEVLRNPLEPLTNQIIGELDTLKVSMGRRFRVFEYKNEQGIPRLNTVIKLINNLDSVNSLNKYRAVLDGSIRKYLSYEYVGRRLYPFGSSVKTMLKDNIRADRIRKLDQLRQVVYDGLLILYKEIAEALYDTNNILQLDVFWDDIKSIKTVEEETVVYDLTVPELGNFIGGYGPVILHNTTAAHALAHDLYGEDYRTYFLELNASDERGIDIIRSKVKEFARSRTPPGIPFRIVLLDEADNMTSDAQQALRRLMELYTVSTRFILIANYPSRIIDPIQSRCALFRFTPLSKEDVVSRLAYILENEGIEYDEDALESIFDISEGDMRKAINVLQAAASLGKVTVSMVYKVVGLAHPVEIREMVQTALKGDFDLARSKLRKLMIEYGLAGTDVLKQIHRELFGNKIQVPEEYRILIADYLGEIHFRVVEGSDDDIQLTAFIAWLSMLGRKLGE
ncbi:MAG: replication factor C small subunit [Desulfurococcales archaeon]|nr:replication factor C small subunit [Desulfurococcales archaeon]